MSDAQTLLIHGGTLVGPSGEREADVLVERGKITALGADLPAPAGVERVDATGCLVFPGLIDSQVHFREPGFPHKEDIGSGAQAAVAGGIVAFMEMPNTKPTTTSPERLQEKLAIASRTSRADHAFFLGATSENAEQLGDWEQLPGCAGVKVFMGSSTGSLLIPDDATLERVLRSGTRRVAIHSEDEPRLQERYGQVQPGTSVVEHPHVRDVEAAVRSTTRLLNLVEKTGRKVHLLHVSTADEVALLRERDLGDLVTAEATPNHLFLVAPECYEKHGSFAQMNPPVRDKRHQDAIRQGLVDGVLACVGSDHAPHTREEKARPYPSTPSGIPGVQTSLPLLLTAVRDGWLTRADIVRVLGTAPCAIYGIEGKCRFEVGADGDAVIVDPTITQDLPESWLESRVGWSPFTGRELAGWPRTTIIRGRVVWHEHKAVGEPCGQPLCFSAT